MSNSTGDSPRISPSPCTFVPDGASIAKRLQRNRSSSCICKLPEVRRIGIARRKRLHDTLRTIAAFNQLSSNSAVGAIRSPPPYSGALARTASSAFPRHLSPSTLACRSNRVRRLNAVATTASRVRIYEDEYVRVHLNERAPAILLAREKDMQGAPRFAAHANHAS